MKNNIKENFTIVTNIVLNDKTISLAAKWLYAFLMSKPDGWDFSYAWLSHQLKEWDKKIRSIVKELVDLWVLLRIPKRIEHNKFNWWEWILHPWDEYAGKIDPKNYWKWLQNTEVSKMGSTADGKEISNTHLSNTNVNDINNKDLILPNSNEIWNSNKNCYIYSNTKYINKLEDEFDIVYDDIPLQRNWHKPYPKPMYETCKKISELCCIRNVKAVFTWEVINKFHYMFTQQWVDVDDLENEYTITNEKNILDVLKKERFWEFYYGKK